MVNAGCFLLLAADLPLQLWQGITAQLAASPRRVLEINLPGEGIVAAAPAMATALNQLPGLQRVNMSNNLLHGSAGGLQLTSLQHLDLGGNRFLGLINASMLPRQLPALLSFNCSGCGLNVSTCWCCSGTWWRQQHK
jgi:Leucine-rich repeat (LRR) protein